MSNQLSCEKCLDRDKIELPLVGFDKWWAALVGPAFVFGLALAALFLAQPIFARGVTWTGAWALIPWIFLLVAVPGLGILALRIGKGLSSYYQRNCEQREFQIGSDRNGKIHLHGRSDAIPRLRKGYIHVAFGGLWFCSYIVPDHYPNGTVELKWLGNWRLRFEPTVNSAVEGSPETILDFIEGPGFVSVANLKAHEYDKLEAENGTLVALVKLAADGFVKIHTERARQAQAECGSRKESKRINKSAVALAQIARGILHTLFSKAAIQLPSSITEEHLGLAAEGAKLTLEKPWRQVANQLRADYERLMDPHEGG